MVKKTLAKQTTNRLLLLQAFTPTDVDAQNIDMINKSIAGAYKGPTRTTCVFYTSTDIFLGSNSATAVINELENIFKKKSEKRPAQYVIVADEYTSWMVKEIYLRGLLKDFRKGMAVAGFFYTECRDHLNSDPSERQSVVEEQLPGLGTAFLQDIFSKFDKACVQGPRQLGLLESIPVDEHPGMNKNNIKMIRGDLERAFKRWIPHAFGEEFPTSLTVTNEKISSPPVPNRDTHQEEDPCQQSNSAAERIVQEYLHNGYPERALSVLDTHMREAAAPPVGSFWADLCRATALLYLGNLEAAKYEFKVIRYQAQEARKSPKADLQNLSEIEEDATLHFASAPFYLGYYEEILDITVKGKVSRKLFREGRDPEITLRTIGLERLKALAISFLGFPDNFGDDPETRICSAQENYDKLEKLANLRDPPKSTQTSQLANDGFEREAMKMEISLRIAKATISMLRGDYGGSLSLFNSILPDATRLLGETNPLTLEAALYTCRLQLAKSQVIQASRLASGIMGIVSKQFGPKSLLIMESAWVLVSVYQAEGRLEHALSASLELCGAIDSGGELRADHLLSLRCKMQLGRLQIMCGNFRDAEKTLRIAHQASNSAWKSIHPTTLGLLSELALAQYHLGKMQLAKTNISSVLRKQIQTYLGIFGHQLWQDDDGSTAALNEWLLSRITKVFGNSNNSCSPKPMIHPDVLSSLLIFGKIEANTKDSEFALVCRVFHLVWDVGVDKLGMSNELVLDAAIALGNLLSLMKPEEREQLRKAWSIKTYDYYFHFVINQGVEFDSHDSTFERRLELTFGSIRLTRMNWVVMIRRWRRPIWERIIRPYFAQPRD